MNRHFRAKYMDRHIRNGKSLALELLNTNINWKNFAVDLRGTHIPLTQEFFQEFVQTIVVEAPILEEDLPNIVWIHETHAMENQIYERLESIFVSYEL